MSTTLTTKCRGCGTTEDFLNGYILCADCEHKRLLKLRADSVVPGPANATQVGGEHYRALAVQPWDAMAAWMTPVEFRGFLRGNAIKYLARAGHKGSALEDYAKARHYLAKLIEIGE
jgi:DNA-directed RNA polymerase subunit RPC12/RpoP